VCTVRMFGRSTPRGPARYWLSQSIILALDGMFACTFAIIILAIFRRLKRYFQGRFLDVGRAHDERTRSMVPERGAHTTFARGCGCAQRPGRVDRPSEPVIHSSEFENRSTSAMNGIVPDAFDPEQIARNGCQSKKYFVRATNNLSKNRSPKVEYWLLISC
jgi:hypothetical protein